MKTIIKSFVHRIGNSYAQVSLSLREKHHKLCEMRVYELLLQDVANVLLNGFIVWMMLLPWTVQPIWYIPSFGLIPFYGYELLKRIKHA